MEILRRLQDAGYEAVLAGGCVRDSLLKRHPKDWDVATSARPEQVEALFDKTIGVGRQFGIVVVVMPDGATYEVATFRGDGRYIDGRRPENVEFVSMREDVVRRDFTVNALLYDPIAEELYDFVDGQIDLKTKMVRAVGDPNIRFKEDKLRMLRAVRFAANLGFGIEKNTFVALRKAADTITMVSQERIFTELDRMLLCGNAGHAFRLLEQSGLMTHILPELSDTIGVEQPPEFHPEGDVWQHTLKILDFFDESLRSRDFDEMPQEEVRALAWATLLHDIGKPGTFHRGPDRVHFNGHDALGANMSMEVMSRMRSSRALADAVRYLVAGHMNIVNFHQMREARKLRRFQDPLFGALLELHRLDCLSSFGGLKLYYAIREEYEAFLARPRPVPPPLNGRDLIAMGYPKGPLFSRILEALADANLERPFRSKKAAMAWVRKNF